MHANYKDWVIEEISDWAESFRDEIQEDEDINLEKTKFIFTFDKLHELITKYKNWECTVADYENLLFHLWQKNGSLNCD